MGPERGPATPIKVGKPPEPEQDIAAPFADLLDAEAVMDALAAKRHEIDQTAPIVSQKFRVFPRGGNWLFAHRGVSYDGIRAEASGREVQAWCAEGGLPRSFTVALSEHGDASAILLCRAWAAKMQHLYDSCLAAPHDKVALGEAFASFEEDPEVQVCFDLGGSGVRRRIQHIRSLQWRGLCVGHR